MFVTIQTTERGTGKKQVCGILGNVVIDCLGYINLGLGENHKIMKETNMVT